MLPPNQNPAAAAAPHPNADWEKIFDQLLYLLGTIGKPINQIGSGTRLLGVPLVGFSNSTLDNFLDDKVTGHFKCAVRVLRAHIKAPQAVENLVDAIIKNGGVQQQ